MHLSLVVAGVVVLSIHSSWGGLEEGPGAKSNESLVERTDAERKVGAAWLGSVVARILNLAHYQLPPITERERQIIQNYAQALDPSGLIFSEKDIDFFHSKWRGGIESDIETGNFTVAGELTDAARIRYKQVLERLPYILGLSGARDVGKFAIFDHEAPRGEPHSLVRFFLKGKLSRGWQKREIEVILGDYRDKIEKTSRDDQIDLFLNAVAKAFDKNSAYYPKDKHLYVASKITLRPTGVGIELKEDGSGRVSQVSANSAAGRDGKVEAGDKVISITDDEGVRHTASTSVTQFRELLAPEAGKSVVVEAEGEDDMIFRVALKSENLDVSDKNQVSSCVVEIDGVKIGILRVPSFYSARQDQGGRRADEDTRLQVLEMLKIGVGSLIVDVRQDSGGAVEAAVMLTGLFLDGVVYHSIDRVGAVQTFTTEGNVVYKGPLVVLVSAGTASAAEIFAKAIQDHGRGIVVGGERTLGKGSQQTLLDLDWHGGEEHFPERGAGSLRITTRLLFGPSGMGIQGVGVRPDISLPCAFDIALQVSRRENKTEALLSPSEIKIEGGRRSLPKSLPLIFDRSASRVLASPPLQKTRALQERFDQLFEDSNFKGDTIEYSEKMMPFVSLATLLREYSPEKSREGRCQEVDPILNEAVNVAADLGADQKSIGSGPVLIRAKTTR